jgi:cbb3-type cytochrome oxidase maturation protein
MSALSLVVFAAAGAGDAAPGSSAPMSAVDIALFASVIGSIVLFGGAAVLALGWAFRNGQFDNFDRGAKSIFGPDEPIGEPTDVFPGMKVEPEDGSSPPANSVD